MGARVKRTFVGVLTTVIVLAIILSGAIAFKHRQQINDHFAAQAFTPSTAVSELADSLQLTPTGERIFFASQPTLDASQRFNKQCENVEHSEDGHILGCFTKQRIHLFKVTDERLDGIVEVTAAHELIHAAFSRMNDRERTELVEQLNALYQEMAPENPKLVERMSVYDGLSETAFGNELFAVLGTEWRDLPDWLEEIYAQWFEDRGVILDFLDSYRTVFDELTQRAAELQSEMAVLREDIEARGPAYSAAVDQFHLDWDSFMQRNASFEFSDNPDEFYRLRDEFYTRRDTLTAEFDALQADLDRYEQMRTELIALNSLNSELEQQLDSNLAPPAPIV